MRIHTVVKLNIYFEIIPWLLKPCKSNSQMRYFHNATTFHSAWGPFYKHGLTLFPARIINNIHYKIWDEMTYPFLNFNTATAEVWKWTSNLILRPSEAIWRHGSGSTWAQVMACCLTAPSHYLNQCWLIISKVKWHSSEGNFIRDTSATIH